MLNPASGARNEDRDADAQWGRDPWPIDDVVVPPNALTRHLLIYTTFPLL